MLLGNTFASFVLVVWEGNFSPPLRGTVWLYTKTSFSFGCMLWIWGFFSCVLCVLFLFAFPYKSCRLRDIVLKVSFQWVYFSRDEVDCAEPRCVLGLSVKTPSVQLKVSTHTIYSKCCSLEEIVAEVAECFGKSILHEEDAI